MTGHRFAFGCIFYLEWPWQLLGFHGAIECVEDGEGARVAVVGGCRMRERERANLVLVGCNSGGGIWGVLGVTVIVREVG